MTMTPVLGRPATGSQPKSLQPWWRARDACTVFTSVRCRLYVALALVFFAPADDSPGQGVTP